MIGLRDSLNTTIHQCIGFWLMCSVCVCVCVCVGKGFGHANPPPPRPCCRHSVSPLRLLWRMMLINLAEITSSRLAAPSIVRMTSSPLLPLRLFTPPSAEERIFNPERSSFKGGEGVLVNAHFHLCSFFPSHHATRAAVLTGRFKHPASKFPY